MIGFGCIVIFLIYVGNMQDELDQEEAVMDLEGESGSSEEDDDDDDDDSDLSDLPEVSSIICSSQKLVQHDGKNVA